jgi:uroporphyrinogen decarboxylase
MIPPYNRAKMRKETEQYRALVRGEQPERTACNIVLYGQAATLHGRTINEFYTKPKMGAQMLSSACHSYGLAFMPSGGTWTYGVPYCEDYGGEVKWPTGNAGAPGITKHPFSKPEEIEEFEPHSPEEMEKGPTITRHWEAMDETERILGRPLFQAWTNSIEPFVIASFWFGPENLLLWVNKEPDLLKKLMSKTVEVLVTANELTANRYGEAALLLASLLANYQTMSPQNCWDFSLRYTKELIERSLKAGAGPTAWFHQCGDHEGDCKLHADLPLPKGSIMHPTYWGLKPSPLSETRKMFEDKWIIQGNVDTASFLNKTPAEIYLESKQQVEEGKDCRKGFIAGIGCEMPPFAPFANVEAFLRAVWDHGKLR